MSVSILPVAVGVLILLGFVVSLPRLKWHVVAWYLGLPRPRYAVTVDRDVMVPMSDGIRLAADVYRPKASGQYPVILTRTPYDKRNTEHKYAFTGGLFASQGYAYVVQDVRGKFASEGEYYPYRHEAQDGHDTIEWAGTQPWSTGKAGTYGFSYWGSTQWLPAPLANPHLRAMVPIVTGQSVYRRWIYNGIYRFNDVLFWHFGNTTTRTRELDGIDLDAAVRHLPAIDAAEAMGADIPAYRDWLSHPTPDAYWEPFCVDDQVERVTAPALLIGGWYDYYLEEMFDDFNRMRTRGGSEAARQSQLLIGPWTHETVSKFEAVDFGAEAAFMPQVKRLLQWFDRWLKEDAGAAHADGPIRLFIMGENVWRSELEWPLARTEFTHYYLHSGGNAATRQGDGWLSREPPGAQPPDRYTYDPADPTPSLGGTSIYGAAVAGPVDQGKVEDRTDVLVYSTAPLEEDVEVTGPIDLVVFAASSAVDTDFVAQLVDVHPDGRAINLRTGAVRARYRESFDTPAPLTPGAVTEFRIRVGATSNLFKKGHRIRLEVRSAHFPEFGRNLNTGQDPMTSTEFVAAEQIVYHDPTRASYLLLPVIPSAAASHAGTD